MIPEKIKDSPLMENCFDYSIGPAWTKLFIVLHDLLVQRGNNKLRIVQVKEKFGDLTIYADYEEDADYQLIGEFIRRASTMCEECGNYAKTTSSRNWLVTLCTTCLEKRNGLYQV